MDLNFAIKRARQIMTTDCQIYTSENITDNKGVSKENLVFSCTTKCRYKTISQSTSIFGGKYGNQTIYEIRVPIESDLRLSGAVKIKGNFYKIIGIKNGTMAPEQIIEAVLYE